MPDVINIALAIFCATTISASKWVQSITSTLPSKDYDISVGIYNQSIYLLGGYMNSRQLTEYIISEDTFVDHGTSLGSDVFGYGQYWTQIDHILYIKQWDNDAIDIFDMNTKAFTTRYITNVPKNTGQWACLASSQTQLFVVGGTFNAINDVSVYDLLTAQWLSNVPPMQSSRASGTCIIHPTTNALYAIAGFKTSTTKTSSIETIEINDIQLKTWTYIQPLSQALAYTRCVAHKNTIYVIGGGFGLDVPTTKVHSINVLTNEVTESPDRTPLALSDLAPIVAEDMIYVFAGYSYDSEGGVNTWMSYDLYIPTSLPSQAPSSQSEAPSSQSEAPTNNPSSSAPTTSNPPTLMPTSTPITSTPTASDSTSAAPITSSDAPSRSPTSIDIVITDMGTTTTMSALASQDSISQVDDDMLLTSIGIATAILVLCVLLFLIVCVWKKCYAQEEETKESEHNIAEVNVESDPVTFGGTDANTGHNAVNVSNVVSGSIKMTRGRGQDTENVVGIAED
eukprot:122731_1